MLFFLIDRILSGATYAIETNLGINPIASLLATDGFRLSHKNTAASFLTAVKPSLIIRHQ
jgi:hypothetical protein